MTKSDELCINTIRLLSADAVQKANSGHPGMPMGAAAMAYTLWTKFMKFDPEAPDWTARDRFVLSAGHGSMLLYSLLHLTGFNISLDDLKEFRQLDSKTPGHPEYHLTPGVETTTGPLGQGFANGVGFAIAQKYLSAQYNRPEYGIFNYNIYAIVSDGDLMEGISSEAASLAGHLRLGNIIYLYDDNHISIEGNTEITFTEDSSKRFEAFGWHVTEVSDGNDVDKISNAIVSAINEKSKPSLIKVRTKIAFGSPNKINTAGAHGSPLGTDELRLTKSALGFDPGKDFFIPEEAHKVFKEAGDKGKKEKSEWDKLFKKYSAVYPKEAEEIDTLLKGNFKKGWEKSFPVFSPEDGAIATRSASGKTLNAISEYFPQLIGGSADLEPSNDTFLKKYKSFQPGSYDGRNFHFGVREHAMGAILNGITLTKPLIAYGGTFLIFSEYMRAPIRLAAIMGIRPVYVFTHDSIALGEDGTTHQPVEQLISLRSIPEITVIRPADANETSEAWKTALSIKSGPVALVLTRQKLPVLDRGKYASAENLSKGAYILSESKNKSDIIIIATGSEVHLALEVQDDLQNENISARVVSMPSWELFEKQSDDYKESVLPEKFRKRVSVEAGSSLGWHKYVTDAGIVIGIDKFGKSAPGDIIMKDFGFDKDLIKNKIKNHFLL
ncbi:MAG TPA: transketolase [Ignavibacteria bacterium]|nr:transketolase [Bacteroidota bacterium]HRI85337.1 transketolase [Ignavibacteria bacterium]HRK00739.1 transketolase [Ignavibacteria bacterium]